MWLWEKIVKQEWTWLFEQGWDLGEVPTSLWLQNSRRVAKNLSNQDNIFKIKFNAKKSMVNKISIFSIRIDSVLLTFSFALAPMQLVLILTLIFYVVSHSPHTSPNPGSENRSKAGRLECSKWEEKGRRGNQRLNHSGHCRSIDFIPGAMGVIEMIWAMVRQVSVGILERSFTLWVQEQKQDD